MPITAELENRLVYGLLRRPTLHDAQESLGRTVGDAAAVWKDLLGQTGLAGAEDTTDALASMAQAMVARGGGVGLCGSALQIRITAFTALGAVEEILAGARA